MYGVINELKYTFITSYTIMEIVWQNQKKLQVFLPYIYTANALNQYTRNTARQGAVVNDIFAHQ